MTSKSINNLILNHFYIKTNAILCCFLLLYSNSFGQQQDSLSFFSPATEFHKTRFRVAMGTAAVTYTGFSIGLYNTWYRKYEQENFHFFNDWNEWRNVDKAGHVFGAHMQSLLLYKSVIWTGIDERKAIWAGALLGGLSQMTIEVMDGFSSAWGFSWSDVGANGLGVGLFAMQQSVWQDQRFILKVSSSDKSYDGIALTGLGSQSSAVVGSRVLDLFGQHRAERYLKDYNAQTIWLSANVNAFFPNAPTPDWLNVSIGYGAENLFGGFENNWSANDIEYSVNSSLHPRYSQYFISPDIDLSRIKVKKPFWKTVLSVLNIFKLPMPTLEYNSTGQFVWHWLFL